jgi:glycosyltransferase involved in cell wall biosynthesis/MoaA/NifB/PqqE/SkfB family radical SAM enzyme
MTMPAGPLEEVQFLQIDPTVRCNYSCAYCRGRSMPQEDLDPPLVDAALDTFPHARFVELHGEGEPLLHPRFFDIAARVRSRGIKISLFTNGSLLHAAEVERLLDAGFEKIVVSMDSADPGRFRAIRTGKFEIVREGIERLTTRRRERGMSAPAVGLSATIQRRFTDDIAGLVAFYQELGLDGGIGYQPLNPALSYTRHYPPELLAEFLSLQELDALFQPVRDSSATGQVLAGSSLHLGLYDELFEPLVRGERVCPWLDRGAYVTTSGFVTPCCMLHDPFALGRIGNTPPPVINQRRDDMRTQLARGVVPGPCEGCEVAALVVAATGTGGARGREGPERKNLPVVAGEAPAGSPAAPPKVSVIIPCFNLGQYIFEAVDSVFAQTDQDFEIIIVNDGSTDEATNTLLAEFSRPKTRVLSTDNRGLAAARNLAVAHARGRYICALDADDRLHPAFIERTTALLDADPSLAFVSTWLETFGDEQWVWRQERCDFPALLAECVVLTAAPARREAIEAIGGYDENMVASGDEDWDLWISLVEKGFRGTIIPEVLFHYRRRPGSMSTFSMRGERRIRLWENMLEKHRASYERYLPEVLALKEAECGRLLLGNWHAEHEIETRLRPQIAGKRAELAHLARQLETAREVSMASDQRVRELEQALEQARAEIEEFRSSWSWRLTAPLRRALDLWLAVRRALRRGPLPGS